MKNHDLPKCTREFLGTAQSAKSRYQHLEQTSTWMTQKGFSLTSNALNQFLGIHGLHPSVSFKHSLWDTNSYPSYKIWGTKVSFRESWRYCAFFFCRAKTKMLTICEDLSFLQRFVRKNRDRWWMLNLWHISKMLFLCNKFTTKQGKTSAFPLRQKVWEHGWGLQEWDYCHPKLSELRCWQGCLCGPSCPWEFLKKIILFNRNNDKGSSSKIVRLNILTMIVTTNNDDTNDKIWQYQQ